MIVEVSASSPQTMTSHHQTPAGHTWIIDEPKAMGGTDQGPNPLEAVLGAWAGCLIIVTRMVAQERGWACGAIHVKTSGEFDPRGFMGVPGVSPYFTHASADLIIEYLAPDQFDALVKALESRCPVSSLLRAAGVQTDLRLTRP
jgi:uncharacterized OsmC-like protein